MTTGRKYQNHSSSVLLFIIISVISCRVDQTGDELQEYFIRHNEWKAERIKMLKSPEGWLNLAGLYWLEEGENSIGSNPGNSIVFPQSAPGKIGVISVRGNRISFRAENGVQVLFEGNPVIQSEMKPDISGDPTLLATGSLAWFIIRRSERYGVRLRDYSHPNILKLDSIPCFPVDLSWKVAATYEPFLQEQTIRVPNIMGMVDETQVPGILKFMIGEQEFKLYPMGNPEHFFLVFGDESSGVDTYGGGRFLNIEPPDQKGNYLIDFNKAYNPPCVFTTYATCPLPPKENILPVRVTAGEKVVEGFGNH
ncbi:MAG: DUF1684 domain-containing protein [Bacteroidales bacterium]|nr:MAG: DUF1684 domain-containing protein [Bacteroidales bacterium]